MEDTLVGAGVRGESGADRFIYGVDAILHSGHPERGAYGLRSEAMVGGRLCSIRVGTSQTQ